MAINMQNFKYNLVVYSSPNTIAFREVRYNTFSYLLNKYYIENLIIFNSSNCCLNLNISKNKIHRKLCYILD